MLFQNNAIKVRELEPKDNNLLAEWLSDPFVLTYYEGRDNPFDIEKVNEKFYVPNDDEVRCMVEYEGIDIGYIQYYQLDKESRGTYEYLNDSLVIYGIDQFIGETNYWNRGIGTLLVKSMVDYLITQKCADIVVMDPQTWNGRAIRCYQKCDFKIVKPLPKHEFHEGEYQDCWLIEYKRSV